MSQYPKMLYKGDQKNFKHTTANSAGEEAELLEAGWVNYVELPKREPGIGAGAASSIDKSKFVPVEQFDALGNENIKLKEELVEALKENQELRKQIRFKQVEDMPADELRKLLDERKVEYGARDGKQVLINLVLESEDQS
ncbi:hypothetical protein [Acinetobacter indicus]|uniref:hypothetical protein n=1 Tax=Acinetobacter indicus TaxID=756892 RepID=UPI00209AC786|nr:hypothetical protein [Acinetobacter indicus]MCO8100125.1 hypothetical protein [Acinetobacter indicus]MCO8105630.1 hypothetical protein [Acinetobacter indicus]MCO8111304.1 hypothetical protein [Acinetobacter indicus]